MEDLRWKIAVFLAFSSPCIRCHARLTIKTVLLWRLDRSLMKRRAKNCDVHKHNYANGWEKKFVNEWMTSWNDQTQEVLDGKNHDDDWIECWFYLEGSKVSKYETNCQSSSTAESCRVYHLCFINSRQKNAENKKTLMLKKCQRNVSAFLVGGTFLNKV